MDYISELDKGNKIICKFKEAQEDYMGDSWLQETWYRKENSNLYICEYLNCSFTTEHTKEEATILLKDNKERIELENATVEIIDNSNSVIGIQSSEYDLYLKLHEKYKDKIQII